MLLLSCIQCKGASVITTNKTKKRLDVETKTVTMATHKLAFIQTLSWSLALWVVATLQTRPMNSKNWHRTFTLHANGFCGLRPTDCSLVELCDESDDTPTTCNRRWSVTFSNTEVIFFGNVNNPESSLDFNHSNIMHRLKLPPLAPRYNLLSIMNGWLNFS